MKNAATLDKIAEHKLNIKLSIANASWLAALASLLTSGSTSLLVTLVLPLTH